MNTVVQCLSWMSDEYRANVRWMQGECGMSAWWIHGECPNNVRWMRDKWLMNASSEIVLCSVSNGSPSSFVCWQRLTMQERMKKRMQKLVKQQCKWNTCFPSVNNTCSQCKRFLPVLQVYFHIGMHVLQLTIHIVLKIQFFMFLYLNAAT